MKCLLCTYDGDDIKEHYIGFHRINKNNYFFKQLFQKNNFCIEVNCIRCQKFLPTNKFMVQHNFLEHYTSGERKPAEFKTIDIIKNKEITIYQITFDKHSEEYDFYNSHEIIDDFLLNIKSIYKPKNKVFFKADFSIENIQNASVVSPHTTDIVNTRFWSSEVYSGVYFNDFIVSEIRFDILKRVINNNLSGSSWHFNRFKHLNLKIIDQEDILHL